MGSADFMSGTAESITLSRGYDRTCDPLDASVQKSSTCMTTRKGVVDASCRRLCAGPNTLITVRRMCSSDAEGARSAEQAGRIVFTCTSCSKSSADQCANS